MTTRKPQTTTATLTTDLTQSTPAALTKLRATGAKRWRHLVTPPAPLSLSEWSDANIVLGFGSSEPGPWRTERTPYLRKILDVLGDRTTRECVVMSSAQIGKTSVMLNLIGYHAAHDPCPVMVAMPNKENAAGFSTTKLDPIIEASPTLRPLFALKSKRDGGNTKAEKTFPGGYVLMGSAKSGAFLRSRSIRVLCLDELDEFPPEIPGQGDPVQIAVKRVTTNPHSYKILYTSTPTVKGYSRIERKFQESTQEYFYVPCPHCGLFQRLQFGGRETAYGLKWNRDSNGQHDPSTAFYLCESGCAILPAHRMQMLLHGEWQAHNPTGKFPGFHVSALYSPWVSFESIVREWLSVCKLPDKVQGFVNLTLGEPYEDKTNKLEASDLQNNLLEYDAPCPAGVALITAGVDVQHESLHVGVWGWGKGEEARLIDTLILAGNTSQQSVWDDLSQFLDSASYPTIRGVPVRISQTNIDSGEGLLNDTILRQVKRLQMQGLKVTPIKGIPGNRLSFEWSRAPGKMGLPKVGNVGVHSIKNVIYNRLQNVKMRGPGFIGFDVGTSPLILEEITSEKKVTIYGDRAGPRIEWHVKSAAVRNEQLDCLVYAYAALHMDRNIAQTLERLLNDIETQDPPAPQPNTETTPEVVTVTHRRPTNVGSMNIGKGRRERFQW